MEDKDILIPCEVNTKGLEEIPKPKIYFKILNALSELETSLSKSQARTNLDVYSIQQVKDKIQELKDELNLIINENKNKIDSHLSNTNDPHNTLVLVQDLLDSFIKKDGSTPFLSTQSGVDPTLPEHLATKSYVDSKVGNSGGVDEDSVINKVKELLKAYALISDTYSKSDINSRFNKVQNDINTLQGSIIDNTDKININKNLITTVEGKVDAERDRATSKELELKGEINTLKGLVENNKIKWIERN